MIRRSLFYAFADKAAGLVLALLTMAIVSRLMTPAEVGLFMVASSLVIMVETFRDFGVGAFLIQEAELTPEIIRSAVTVTTLLSLALGGLIYAGAGLAGAVYGNADLTQLIQIASLGFLAAPISNPLLALLRRDMRFGAVAGISFSMALVNSATTILLAAAGYGAYSFVWGSVMAAGVTAIGAVICQPQLWILSPSLKHWRRVVPFGAWSSVVTLLGMLYDAIPRLLLGRLIGFDAVGLFSRAVSLTQLPDKLMLSAIQPVVLSALSAKARAHENLLEPYMLGLSLISVIQWPALATIVVLADPIVRILLGPQWLDVIPLVRIVALAAIPTCTNYLTFPLLVALGQLRKMALVSLVTLPLSIAVILLAAPLGLTVVAWAMVLANVIQVGSMLTVVHRHLAFVGVDIRKFVRLGLTVTACSIAVPLAMVAVLGPSLSIPMMILATVGAVAGWAVGLGVLSHPLAAEFTRLVTVLRQLNPWPRAA